MTQLKVKETETHIYFWNGCLSNWHKKSFTGTLTQNGIRLEFNCGEQYIMASKASLFDDQETLAKIMNADNPTDQKQFGREVKNFNQDVWNDNIWNVAFRTCWFKQQGDSIYRSILLNSDEKIIVEGSPFDKIWGVGLAWDDLAILNEDNWKGLNILGESHMKVRTLLRRQNDPWLVTNEYVHGNQ